MKKILIFLCVYISISCTQPQNRTERAEVVRTIDGDTFDVRMKDGTLTRIRMAYIDAPEIGQNFGLAANYVLDSLIGDKHVLLYTIDIDQYGRTVAIVYDIITGKSINEFMVDRGMAWAYQKYAPVYLYKKQLEAKEKRKGLWQNPYPIPPYEFRNQNK